MNFDNTQVRVKKPNVMSVIASLTYSYGCINWHPLDLPKDKTPESLKEKKREMTQFLSQDGPRAAENGQVEDLMKITHAWQ